MHLFLYVDIIFLARVLLLILIAISPYLDHCPRDVTAAQVHVSNASVASVTNKLSAASSIAFVLMQHSGILCSKYECVERMEVHYARARTQYLRNHFTIKVPKKARKRAGRYCCCTRHL